MSEWLRGGLNQGVGRLYDETDKNLSHAERCALVIKRLQALPKPSPSEHAELLKRDAANGRHLIRPQLEYLAAIEARQAQWQAPREPGSDDEPF